MVDESTTDEVKEQARGLAQSAGEQAGQLKETVREQATQVAGEAAAQGREVLDRAKLQVRRQGEVQAQQLASSARRLSDQTRALADGRPTEAGPVLDYVRQASDRLQGFADHVEWRGAEGLVHDVEDFGRRRPGLFLAGAAVGGFVLGRIIRGARDASAASDAGQRQPAPTAWPPDDPRPLPQFREGL